MGTKELQTQKAVILDTMNRIDTIRESGSLHLPADYSAENAIQAASLMIAQVVDKNKKPALEVCTRESIANSLLYMVTQGLNPLKMQCYFVVFGETLQCMRSYQGSIALAKRFGGLKDINPQVIFKDDEFEYEIDSETGRKRLIKHKQDALAFDGSEDSIRGAYTVIILEDGTKDLEIMNINQIKEAWNMGQTKGKSKAHENFSEEMCKRTVINRACKPLINTSNDRVVMPITNATAIEAGEKQPKKVLAIEAEEVQAQLPETKKEVPNEPKPNEVEPVQRNF